MTADPGRAPVPVAASPVAAQDAVLEIRDLSVVYRTPGGDVRAVDKVNLSLAPGEVVGLCGESGSGKSTLVYGASRLLRAPALITSGSVTYSGRRVTKPADVPYAQRGRNGQPGGGSRRSGGEPGMPVRARRWPRSEGNELSRPLV